MRWEITYALVMFMVIGNAGRPWLGVAALGAVLLCRRDIRFSDREAATKTRRQRDTGAGQVASFDVKKNPTDSLAGVQH